MFADSLIWYVVINNDIANDIGITEKESPFLSTIVFHELVRSQYCESIVQKWGSRRKFDEKLTKGDCKITFYCSKSSQK